MSKEKFGGFLSRFGQRYAAWTSRHWVNQPLVSSSLATAGDVTAQVLGEQRSLQELDLRRTLAFGSFGFAYSGILIPRWFKFLASQVHCRSTHGIFAGWSLRQCNVARIALDMGGQAPIFYIPTFFYSTGMIRGQTVTEATETLQTRYNETLRNCWMVFTPSQAINFMLMPPQLRVLFANSIAFLWVVGLSMSTNKAAAEKEQEQEQQHVDQQQHARLQYE